MTVSSRVYWEYIIIKVNLKLLKFIAILLGLLSDSLSKCFYFPLLWFWSIFTLNSRFFPTFRSGESLLWFYDRGTCVKGPIIWEFD